MQGGGAGFVHCRAECAAAAARALRAEASQRPTARAAAPMATAEQARAYSVWARLEREYALSEERAAETGGLLLPRHSRDRFLDFVEWMASDAERASLRGQVRMAVGTFVPQTRLTDWSADGEIAAALMES